MKAELINKGFKEYIDAEISVMRSDIGPNIKPGSTRFGLRALKWIEENAADFRMKWNREKNMIVDDSIHDRKEFE